MTSHLLQRPESAAKPESNVLRHSQADNYVRFLCAVAVLRNSSEGNANEPFLVKKFGEQIDVQRLYAVIKDNEPIIPVSDLAYGPWHQFSISVRAS